MRRHHAPALGHARPSLALPACFVATDTLKFNVCCGVITPISGDHRAQHIAHCFLSDALRLFFLEQPQHVKLDVHSKAQQ
jgi:hypothetical protein